MAKLISQTYGQALFELAQEDKKIKELTGEVTALRGAFAQSSELMQFMKHPGILQEDKVKLIEDSLKGKISSSLLGFLVILTQKERFCDVIDVFDYYLEKVRLLEGIGRALVTAPKKLTEIQKANIKEKLLKTTGFKEMEVVYETDASLIGGIVIRVGDRVIDGSIKTRLNNLKKTLTQM